MPNNRFNLRELQSSDSPALEQLITQFDGDMTTQFLVDAYTAMICGTENQILGVGVETAGFEGLVGVGTVRFSQVQFNGEILPLAFLDGLKVHQDFRRQGLGFQIASWRIQKAREAWGENCVIATGLLRSNDASRGVARKWCREFIDTAYQPVILPISSRPPKPQDWVTVREIEPAEQAEFAAKQNACFQDHNLYPPGNTHSMTHALEVTAGGVKPYCFYAALDSHGSLLAGAQVWRRGLLKADFFSNPPLPLRLVNKVAHILPPDFILRDAAVTGLWHAPGQVKAAQFLWKSLLWVLRDQATHLALSLDPRDPLREVAGNQPVYMPRIEITVALHGPEPVDRQKLLFGYGRI